MRLGVAADGEVAAALADLLEEAGLSAGGLRGACRPALVREGETTWLVASGADALGGCVRGALDAAITGKDSLLELAPDVYELLDLRAGADALVLAAPATPLRGRRRARPRVATPYPRFARAHFAATGHQVEAFAFGAAGLAPALGLADEVVDLRSRVATVPGLEVMEVLAESSLRLVAARAARALRAADLAALVERLRALVEGR